MNRKQRRIHAAHVQSFSKKLTQIPKTQWPSDRDPSRIETWRSSQYLVQVFQEKNGVKRLSINRTTVNDKGRWNDEISWDELQQIKADVGLASKYAVEIFPADEDVVNVANMRHLWVLPEPLEIGWRPNPPKEGE